MPLLARARPVQRDCREAHFLRQGGPLPRGWGVLCGHFCFYPKLLSPLGLFPGEANIDFNRDLYNCTFPALIEDWRQTFHLGSQGQTECLFPFGFVQVCVEGRRVYRPCHGDVPLRSPSWNPYSSFTLIAAGQGLNVWLNSSLFTAGTSESFKKLRSN